MPRWIILLVLPDGKSMEVEVEADRMWSVGDFYHLGGDDGLVAAFAKSAVAKIEKV